LTGGAMGAQHRRSISRDTGVEIHRSALIGLPAERTFDLIEAAEHYPEFLPWCSSAVILARDESMVAARITVSYHGLRFDLTTRNPKRRPEWLAIRMEKGPFRRFEGEWELKRLGDDACRIELAMRYEFDNALGRIAGRVFDGIADTIVDAFARRAEQQLASEAASRASQDASGKLA
jgi:ribosome-associated toxin RatA of RatAB toxin-antitoxin module